MQKKKTVVSQSNILRLEVDLLISIHKSGASHQKAFLHFKHCPPLLQLARPYSTPALAFALSRTSPLCGWGS